MSQPEPETVAPAWALSLFEMLNANQTAINTMQSSMNTMQRTISCVENNMSNMQSNVNNCTQNLIYLRNRFIKADDRASQEVVFPLKVTGPHSGTSY